MLVRERFTKKEYLHKLPGGDPKRQKEVFSETVQQVSTRGMAMQIPCSLVPEIPVSNSARRAWAIAEGYPEAIMRVEANRDPGRKHPGWPYPSCFIHTAEVLHSRGNRVFERQERNQDIRYASWTEKTLLGPTFLVERVLRQHHWFGRRPDQAICSVASP